MRQATNTRAADAVDPLEAAARKTMLTTCPNNSSVAVETRTAVKDAAKTVSVANILAPTPSHHAGGRAAASRQRATALQAPAPSGGAAHPSGQGSTTTTTVVLPGLQLQARRVTECWASLTSPRSARRTAST